MRKLPSDLSTVTTVAVDLAKHIFQVHGCDAAGKVVVAKALRRKELLPFFAALGPILDSCWFGGVRFCASLGACVIASPSAEPQRARRAPY